MKRIILSALLLLSYNAFMNAQISTEEKPFSFQKRSLFTPKKISVIELNIMSSIDRSEIDKEDMLDEQYDVPPRFGIKEEVNFTLDNSGTWTVLENGDKLWQLSIYSKEALSINLLYDKFWLPEGGKFFIYSKDAQYTLGAFTAINNKGDKTAPQGFATELIFSDHIVLEYYQPSEVKDNAIISVSHVVHGYRMIPQMTNTKVYGESGSCNININCSEGQGWNKQKDAVAMILVNGNRYCSGALINTTANDMRPLFLTADHCLGGGGGE